MEATPAYWVYVLKSGKTGRLYTGSCEDVDERLRRHNAGHSPATRHGVPWSLVYRETQPSRAEAVRSEAFLKTGAGRDELKRILADQLR